MPRAVRGAAPRSLASSPPPRPPAPRVPLPLARRAASSPPSPPLLFAPSPLPPAHHVPPLPSSIVNILPSIPTTPCSRPTRTLPAHCVIATLVALSTANVATTALYSA